MSLYRVITTTQGPAEKWDGVVWEGDTIANADDAVAEYNAILRDNVLSTLSELHEGNVLERYSILISAEIDRMNRWGKTLAELTPFGENVTQIDDEYYRVELRVVGS